MKKTIKLIITLTFLVSTNLFSQPTDYVAYWPMNGNAYDMSPNNYHGTMYSDVGITSDRNGNTNSALNFDGADDYIQMGNVLDPGTSDFSYCYWVKVNNKNDQTFIHNQDPVTNTGYYIQYYHGTLRAYFNGTSYGINMGDPLTIGTWHHVAVTVDRNGLMTGYVDGVRQGTPVDISAVDGVD